MRGKKPHSEKTTSQGLIYAALVWTTRDMSEKVHSPGSEHSLYQRIRVIITYLRNLQLTRCSIKFIPGPSSEIRGIRRNYRL